MTTDTSTILIIGSGGREHALAWTMARSAGVERVYVAPGNGGTEWAHAPGRAPSANVPLEGGNVAGLLDFARKQQVGLTVVGPEGPLAAGIVDAFQAAGLAIFGPTQAAAQLEASKAFAKAFMDRHDIPTADYGVFTDYETAVDYLATTHWPDGIVVKASGLAAGKGVIVCDSVDEARAALTEMMVEQRFGEAGGTILIEERLSGPELSLLALSDGRTVKPLVPARDHKRIYDHDEGPNTGGMGAYAPPPDVDAALVDELMATVMRPAVAGMAAEDIPYTGVLYAGLMLTAGGPKVLEFNCRFGDPETQAILPLLQSDLAALLAACVDGRLAEIELQMRPGSCATIVMAAPGYPGSYPKGLPISGVETAAALEDVIVFHAGTGRRAGKLVTSGGRVLAVSAVAEALPAALDRAYGAVAEIRFKGAQYRRDIGRFGPVISD